MRRKESERNPWVPLFEKAAEREDGMRLWYVNEFELYPEVSRKKDECLTGRRHVESFKNTGWREWRPKRLTGVRAGAKLCVSITYGAGLKLPNFEKFQVTIQHPLLLPTPTLSPILDDHWLERKMSLGIDVRDIAKETLERFD